MKQTTYRIETFDQEPGKPGRWKPHAVVRRSTRKLPAPTPGRSFSQTIKLPPRLRNVKRLAQRIFSITRRRFVNDVRLVKVTREILVSTH